MNCNIWWSLEGAKVRLSEEDFRALHQLRRGIKRAAAEADAWPLCGPVGNGTALNSSRAQTAFSNNLEEVVMLTITQKSLPRVALCLAILLTGVSAAVG